MRAYMQRIRDDNSFGKRIMKHQSKVLKPEMEQNRRRHTQA